MMEKTTCSAANRWIVCVSWVTLLASIACLTLTAWYIPVNRRIFFGIFRDFGAELPSLTKVMLCIPDQAFHVAGGVIVCFILISQWRARAKSIAVIIHLCAIVACCVILLIYREAMFQPLFSIMQSINGVQTH
jgi:type II secretory pathway component PulF